MANVIPNAFKGELLSGTHNFASGGNSFKLALYTSNPYDTSSTAYSTTNEVSASGGSNYTTTGLVLQNQSVTTGAPASTNGTYTSNKYQDLLLYACLVEAYGYLKGPADMLQYYEGSYRRALQSYAVEQMGRRRRDEYQDGVIRTPLQSPSP